ncbi:MAG: glycosyltransferase [Bacteroidia bacterium]|nr:glycosyltransferase [Bacteroidia bacterium]
MEGIKVSVVIPNFNRAELLLRALRSALEQTYPVHEILICDDGSTDNSKEAVHSLKNERVKWIDCGRNERPAIPRNIGIKLAEGDYIAFLDNDDFWHCEKIEKQLNIILQKKYKICSTNALKIDPIGNQLGSMLDFNKDIISFEDLTKNNPIICSSVLIEKNFLIKTSFFPEDIHLKAYEDFALWIRIAHFEDIYFINENLVYYQDHFNSSIRSKNFLDGWDALKISFDAYKKWIMENNITINENKKQILKTLYKKIKRKGKPTFSEELMRHLKIRLNKYLGI